MREFEESLEVRKQMTGIRPGALTDSNINWHAINWDDCWCCVKRLQMRIAKAVLEGRYGKVKSLQWLLTHSFHAKLLAVKRVTTNRHSFKTILLTVERGISVKQPGYYTNVTFEMLELYDGKLSRTVLRGESGSDACDLPGAQKEI